MRVTGLHDNILKIYIIYTQKARLQRTDESSKEAK